MTDEFRELSSPDIHRSSTHFLDELRRKTIENDDRELFNKKFTEEHRRHLLDEEISQAHEKGFWVCRLWQLLLSMNLMIIIVTIGLVLLLLFSIGPLGKLILTDSSTISNCLEPYQSYGQSCRSLSCNSAYGLICSPGSICVCPSNDSYWSWNDTGCRMLNSNR